MSVPFKTTPTFTPGPPVPVVAAPQTLRNWSMGPNYDVSPDGRRFLMIKAPGAGHQLAHGCPELGCRGGGNDREGLSKVRFCDFERVS